MAVIEQVKPEAEPKVGETFADKARRLAAEFDRNAGAHDAEDSFVAAN
jgi:hypothetical protein